MLQQTTHAAVESITDHWFSTLVLLKINPAWHHRTNETPPCTYNGACWIHMEE
jgi:hypothetical protein